ncbi:lipoate-protein ligase [Lachnospiraceae bacterium KHCPX20]|nr:lipoate-protein ligase [Lachnospiraceae bacterium KHCPX20]
MRFKYLIGTETDPYRNLATEQALLKFVSDGTAVLYLWQNDNTIVIGRNQDIDNECRADKFLAEGGRIARRRSGGGAVYHDMGNLNFSILSAGSQYESVAYQNIIMKALGVFGIESEYNGRNDIMVAGMKCSGNAVYQDGNMLCQHGTLLIDTNIRRMTEFLTPEKSKLDRNHVSSISSRVVNLKEVCDRVNVKSMIQAFVSSTDAEEMECAPSKEVIEKLTAFYKSREWVFGGKR